ncbi:hypothetical protein R1flu_010279 [Riccia fluitans]|uniref:Uncharacterized protein n=1 Tax=Riccia fluitans TaxID=41844 RepID=A0ABD1Z8R7_9MARC
MEGVIHRIWSLDQEASMQNIDRLVEALEMEAIESGMSKHKKLFLDEPSSLALQVYEPLDREEPSSSAVQVCQSLERSIVSSFLNFGITLEELSMLSRDEVFPYVNTHRLKTNGILKISGWVVDDFKKFALKGHPDGYALEKQVCLVINQVQRMVGLSGPVRREDLFVKRKALKEELNKAKEMAVEAKEMAAEAEQRTKVVRLEKEAL